MFSLGDLFGGFGPTYPDQLDAAAMQQSYFWQQQLEAFKRSKSVTINPDGTTYKKMGKAEKVED